MLRALADLAGMKRGTLSIFASQTIINYWLPPFLAMFHQRYPDIKLKLSAGNTQQVAAATHEGAADIGFVEGTIDDPHLSVRSIEGDKLVVVVGPTHPLASKPKLDPCDLKSTKWVLREPGSGTRGEFEGALKSLSMTLADLDVALELPSNEAVCAAVEAGVGATAISNLVAKNPGCCRADWFRRIFPFRAARSVFCIIRSAMSAKPNWRSWNWLVQAPHRPHGAGRKWRLRVGSRHKPRARQSRNRSTAVRVAGTSHEIFLSEGRTRMPGTRRHRHHPDQSGADDRQR